MCNSGFGGTAPRSSPGSTTNFKPSAATNIAQPMRAGLGPGYNTGLRFGGGTEPGGIGMKPPPREFEPYTGGGISLGHGAQAIDPYTGTGGIPPIDAGTNPSIDPMSTSGVPPIDAGTMGGQSTQAMQALQSFLAGPSTTPTNPLLAGTQGTQGLSPIFALASMLMRQPTMAGR